MNKLYFQSIILLLILLDFVISEDAIPYCPKQLTPYTSSDYIPTTKLKIVGWDMVPKKGKKKY